MSWLDTAITYRHVLYVLIGGLGLVATSVIVLITWALIENHRMVVHARRYYDGDEG